MTYAIYQIRFPEGDDPIQLIQELGGSITALAINQSFECLAKVEGSFPIINLKPWKYRPVENDEALNFAVSCDSRVTMDDEGVLNFPLPFDPYEQEQ
jgi:hypothetical protein